MAPHMGVSRKFDVAFAMAASCFAAASTNQPMKSKITLLLSLLFTIQVAQAQVSQLTPLTTFGTNGNGTILPGQRPYLTDGTTNTGVTTHELQRSMAYNPTTGHLLILSRTNIETESTPYCAIIDAATGTDVGTLSFGAPGVGANAGFDFNVIAIAADGSIYIGDQTSSSQSGGSSPGSFNLYYWANESSDM